MRRSKLFAPGDRPDLMAKAARTAADGLSIDLEDAVAAGQKAKARHEAARFIAEGGARQELILRVNDISATYFVDDVLSAVVPGLHVVNLPKVEAARDVWLLEKLLDHVERKAAFKAPVGIMATIESPAGLANAREIAKASPRLVALQLGFGDLLATRGIARTGEATAHAYATVKYAAAEAGLDALDSAYTDVKDLAGLEAEARRSRAWGFAGKSCIHPTQIETVNRTFAPSEAEIAAACEIVAEYEARAAKGEGAFLLHGKLIDWPFYEAAKRAVAASRSGS